MVLPQGLHEVAVTVLAGTEGLPGAEGPPPRWLTPTPGKLVLAVGRRFGNSMWTSSEGYLGALTTWQLSLRSGDSGVVGERTKQKNKKMITNLLMT